VEALRNALQGIMLEQTPVTMGGKKVKTLHLNFYSRSHSVHYALHGIMLEQTPIAVEGHKA